jgi:tRNA (guanine37-N1)-methyltransferase
MNYYFLTLFPEVFHPYFHSGMMGRSVEKGIINYTVINIRDYSEDKHHQVDDTPYGGGAGMVMTAAPIVNALKSIPNYTMYPIIYLTPSGKSFQQEDSKSLANETGIIFICGHYEGIDQRVIDEYVDYEYSVGDYILTGGELPALTLSDSIARHLSGFLGNHNSLDEESFESDLLEYPHYTKPREFENSNVPDVLLSGNHQAIKTWRHTKAIEKTKQNRIDLFDKYKKKTCK